MKNSKFYTGFVCLLFSFSAFAQVNIDHAVVLTGSGTNAKVTGIASVSTNTDAVNVNSLQQGGLVYAADSSTHANTYTVPIAPILSGSTYTAGMVVNFKANLANTGGATLSVNGFTAAPIVKYYDVALAANDIQSGQMVTVMFDGTNWQMLSQLGNAPSSAGDPTLTYTTNGF